MNCLELITQSLNCQLIDSQRTKGEVTCCLFVCYSRKIFSPVVYLFTYCLGSKQKKVTLNSSDELYADLRDLHFASVGPYLSRRAKNLNVVMDERHMAQSVSQLRVFVAKIPHIQVPWIYSITEFQSMLMVSRLRRGVWDFTLRLRSWLRR